jgi:hypothetical protein
MLMGERHKDQVVRLGKYLPMKNEWTKSEAGANVPKLQTITILYNKFNVGLKILHFCSICLGHQMRSI